MAGTRNRGESTNHLNMTPSTDIKQRWTSGPITKISSQFSQLSRVRGWLGCSRRNRLILSGGRFWIRPHGGNSQLSVHIMDPLFIRTLHRFRSVQNLSELFGRLHLCLIPNEDLYCDN